MYSFLNDYSEGASPAILNAIINSNLEQTTGYGTDEYCEKAKEMIKNIIKCENADIHFLVGGTQTNQTAVSAFLRPHQAVISAATGHVNVHETGAIEATGHKVVVADSIDGRLTGEFVDKVVKSHPDEHMVCPKLVYISNSTELGTVYTKAQLSELYDYCKENGLYLYMDGARLASALMSEKCDLTMEDLPKLTDAFYIGGTKNGALFGEALVIINDRLKEDFRYMIKRHGGLFAKGRLLGIQFMELFTNDLYFENAKHANEMALKIKKAMQQKGYLFASDSYTNLQFPIMSKADIKRLSEKFKFEVEKPDEDESPVRFVTSWATTNTGVDELLKEL